MRLIDADALIEKCGGWYVDECTESGFIGTLENLLATEPTIQPQSTTGQLNDGARSTAQSTDLIDRQAAIDALDKQIKQCCKALGSFSLSDVDKHAVEVEMASIRAHRKMLENLPTVQQEPTDEQKSCEYCHEDSDGYTRPIEKNCHAYIRFGMNGWELDLKAKGWHGEAQIKFCPMCGRKLQGGR